MLGDLWPCSAILSFDTHLCRLCFRIPKGKEATPLVIFCDTGVEYWGTSVIHLEMPRMGLDSVFDAHYGGIQDPFAATQTVVFFGKKIRR